MEERKQKERKRRKEKENSQASPPDVIISLGQPRTQLAMRASEETLWGKIGARRESVKQQQTEEKIYKYICEERRAQKKSRPALNLTRFAQSGSKIRSSYCAFII